MTTKLCIMVIYFEGLALVKSHGFLSRGLVKSRGKLKKISTIIMSVATKLDRVMTNHKGFPIIMPHDPSFTWPCEVA